MSKAFEFCIPTRGTKVPTSPDCLHEIKYDGYRLRVERFGDRVRLFTRNGYDWAKRYPRIGEAALKNRMRQFVIDGDAVILGVDGVSDFDAPCPAISRGFLFVSAQALVRRSDDREPSF
jgi:ATP-dependent DNA ligase